MLFAKQPEPINLTLYTIGYVKNETEALNLRDFQQRLKQHNIKRIFDLRTAGLYHHGVDKYLEHDFRLFLKDFFIHYQHCNEAPYQTYYTHEGLSDLSTDKLYEIAQTKQFAQELAQMLNFVAQTPKGENAALLEFRLDPYRCYRHRLVARTLLDPRWKLVAGNINVTVQHILPNGSLSQPVERSEFFQR